MNKRGHFNPSTDATKDLRGDEDVHLFYNILSRKSVK